MPTRFPTLATYLVSLAALVALIVFGASLPRPLDLALLALFLTVEPFISLVASVYIWVIYFRDRDRPRSWLLFWLALFMTLISVGLMPIAWLAVRREMGGASLDPETAGIVIGASIAVVGSVPIHLAILLYRVRHGKAPITVETKDDKDVVQANDG